MAKQPSESPRSRHYRLFLTVGGHLPSASQEFKEFLTATRSLLDKRDVEDNQESAEDILDVLESRGYISIGDYGRLKHILSVANLGALYKIVVKEERTIKEQMELEDPVKRPTNNSSEPGPLSIIKDELRDWYTATLSKLKPIPSCNFFEMDMDHMFANLTIVHSHKHKLSKGTQEEDRQKMTKIIETLEELANELWTRDTRTVTFIEGDPGVGKSTLCRRLAYTWAKNNYKIHNFDFQIVILLESRAMHGDLEQSICEQVFPEQFKLDGNSIFRCMTEIERHCLIIIDGVDEIDTKSKTGVINLLKGRLFRKAQVVLTGRKDVTKDYVKSCDNHLCITGFNGDNRNCYINRYFTLDQGEIRDKLLQRIYDDRALYQLTLNPFTTLLVCILVEESEGELPTKRFDILKQINIDVCKRFIHSFDGKGTPPSKDELLSAARNLAFMGIQSGKYQFDEDFVKANFSQELSEQLLRSGILTRDVIVSRRHCMGRCYFPHATMQEALCVEHIAVDSGEIFNQLWNSVRDQSSSFLRGCLLNILVSHPDKFEIVLTDLMGIIDDDEWAYILENLLDVNSQNLLIKLVNTTLRLLTYTVNRLYEDCDGLLKFLLMQKTFFAPVWEVNLNKEFIPLIHDIDALSLNTMRFAIMKVWKFHFPRGTHFNSSVYDMGELRSLATTRLIVNCYDPSDALKILESCLEVSVLNICILGLDNLAITYILKLIDMLEDVNRPMRVFLVIHCGMEDDYNALQLLALISSAKCQKANVHVHVNNWLSKPNLVQISKPEPYTMTVPPCSSMPEHICEGTLFRYEFKLPSSLHRMYFDKYCPY